MGTFRKTIKYTKSSKSLDEKIQRLNEELVKTGIQSPSLDDSLQSNNLFNWRNEFSEKVDLKEEVDIVIEEVKEKNKYLSSVENSIKQHKLNEANVTFNEIYGDQVNTVVENYISKYAGEINHLKEDIFVELNKKPKNLKVIENRLDDLDDKYNVLSERIYKSLKASRENNITEETQVSYKQLKDHYQRLVSKLQEQIAMAGSGGGEVRLKYLDDIVGVATNASAYDGKFLKYDHSQEKFVFETVSGGGGGGGISYSDLSAITTAPSESSSLTYDNITGIFLYSPPNLSGFTTSGDLSSYLTSSDLVGFTTEGDLVGFTTSGDLSSYLTSSDLVGFTTEGDLVGFTTSGDLVGFATAGDVSGYLSEGSDGSSLTGIVTSIVAGAGINISSNTGIVTITATGGGASGIVYDDLSAIVTSPGISTLNYNNITGEFLYTPPDLSSYTTSADLVGFTTSGDLSSYLTSSDLVGFVSTTDLTPYILEGSDGSSLTGIVTAIFAGAGINISSNTGIVTITAIGGGGGVSGIAYTDLSVTTTSPGISTLSYDDATGQFTYTPPAITGGIEYTDLSVSVTAPGSSTLSYNNSTGQFTYTPPATTGGIEYTDLSVSVTSPGVSTLSYDDLVGTFSYTPPDLSGIVTSIVAGAGINIDQNAGIVTITATGGGASGIVYDDLSVSVNVPGISTLTYNNTTGEFAYTPPDLSSYATTSDLVGFVTTGDLSSYATTGDLVGFVTTGDLSSYATTGDLVGFTTSGDLVGFATAGDVSGYLSEGSDGSSLTGIVTSIVAGSGISVDQSTGSVTITATGGGASGIQYTDLSAFNDTAGESSLDYNNTTGQFTYTPPDLTSYLQSDGNGSTLTGIVTSIVSAGGITVNNTGGSYSLSVTGFATTGDLVGLATIDDLVGFVTTGDLSSYATTGDLVGFTTSGDLVGFTTSGDLVGLATTGDLVGFTTAGDIDSTFNNLTPTYLTVSGIATFSGGMQESFDTLTNATSLVNHDCSNGNVFYHTTPSSDWTVNLTNFALTAEYVTTITIVVNQGDPAYMPTQLEIGGTPQSIKWQGNSTPSGTASGIDVVSFSILNDGGTYVVMGQSVSFGGV
jgi:hypothetical protein